MTNKELRDFGELYDANYDPELVRLMDECKDKCWGLDLALDAETAAIKGMKSPVAGDADCLVFPNLEASNVFYKCCSKFDKSEIGAMLMGAKVPCVLSSRGDTSKTKLYSIALAAMLA